jgi:hypothetical protein
MANKPIPKAAQRWSYWQQMRREAPHEYYQASVQNRMVADRNVLGADGFYAAAAKARPKASSNDTFAEPEQLEDMFAEGDDGENQ